jgi:hypothetical protein
MTIRRKLLGAALGGALLASAAPASAGLMGDTVYINGNPYTVGSGPLTLVDGWMPLGSDDDATINMGSAWISVSLYAPDLIFYWNYSGGANFTLSFTDLDWDVPGSYIDGISWAASGDAQAAGIAASLVSGSAIDVTIPGEFDCDTSSCGAILIEISAYEPPPTSVPEPATIALFGLGLAGFGVVRRRKSA